MKATITVEVELSDHDLTPAETRALLARAVEREIGSGLLTRNFPESNVEGYRVRVEASDESKPDEG